MKKLAALSSIASVALLFSSVPADAQGIRIGTVDMNKIFSSYYKTKDAESRINEARAAAKKELDDRMENYKKNLDTINKLNQEINKPELSKDAKDDKSKSRDEKIAETKNLEREIGEFRTTREKQLQEQAVRMRNGIVDEITKLVQERVKTDQFDIVFDRSGSSLNGVPILVFAKDTLDFSEDIITSLNKNKPAGGSASAPAASPAPAEKKK
jgi:outer membrane protein